MFCKNLGLRLVTLLEIYKYNQGILEKTSILYFFLILGQSFFSV